MTDKFTLLERNYPEDEIDADHQHIRDLRNEARALREEHNVLVHQVWDIDDRISKSKDTANIELLEKEKAALLTKIEASGNVEKVKELVEEIKALEIAVDGHSDINDHSPYIL